MLRIRIGTERSQLCRRIGGTDHREGSSLVLSIERSELGRIVRGKATAGCILWIVKPEPEVKGIGRRKSYVRVEAEDLVEQDRLDANVAVIATPADFDV